MGKEKPALLTLAPGDEEVLRSWRSSARTPDYLRLRTSIVLCCSQRKLVREVSEQVGVSHNTVDKWRARYERDGLLGLVGSAVTDRVFDDSTIEEVLHRLAKGPGRSPDTVEAELSTRGIARLCGISQSTASRIQRTLTLECPLVTAGLGGLERRFAGRRLHALRGLLVTGTALGLVLDLEEGERCGPSDATHCAGEEGDDAVSDLLRSVVSYVRVPPGRRTPARDRDVVGRFTAALGPIPRGRSRAIVLGGRHARLEDVHAALEDEACEAHVAPLEAGWFRIARIWMSCWHQTAPAGFDSLRRATHDMLRAPEKFGTPLAWIAPQERD